MAREGRASVMTGSVRASRILLVEDSESNRYVLATWLRRAGHEVVEARSGGQALESLADRPVDLVVLDVNLPDMSGYEVCERIKGGAVTAGIPVLHVSATATDLADRTEGLRRGAEGYLVEPVEREELLATVEALLRAAHAQQIAVRLAARLRDLNAATLAVTRAVDFEELLVTIAQEASRLFAAPALLAAVVGARAVAAFASPEHLHPAAIPIDEERVDALRSGEGALPALVERVVGGPTGASDYLHAALDDAGSHRGVLLVGVPEGPEPLTIADETEVVLSQYARAASTALRNVRLYDIERRIALTLQRSLLPDLVVPPGLEVAVRYEASTEHAAVGGDFYDVFALDDARAIIAIGDVEGHSLEAATVMSQLRTAIRSCALLGYDPAAILDHLNRLLRRFHPDLTATVCCIRYDRSSGLCELANAGHPAPLIARAGERPGFLPDGGALLGVEVGPRPEHHFALGPGDVLLLFTDGLIERRHERVDVGLGRLMSAAEAPIADLNALCERILCEAGPRKIIDDIALLAVRPSVQDAAR